MSLIFRAAITEYVTGDDVFLETTGCLTEEFQVTANFNNDNEIPFEILCSKETDI